MDSLVKEQGTDGHTYNVAPTEWSLALVHECWDHIKQFNIFSDEVERSEEGFLAAVVGLHAVWFSIADEDLSQLAGLMYLTDVISGAKGTLASATWHAMLWDAKAGPRRPVLKAAVRALFRKFGFHRLQAEIPCNHGGVIRAARKIGFVPEGRLREARRYNGVWYDAVILGLLEHEVEQ
jgi:RimJ/RimL family protein N-acetyltransferase